MQKILYAIVAVLAAGLGQSAADAAGPFRGVVYARAVQSAVAPQPTARFATPLRTAVVGAVNGVAQMKANVQAAAGRMFHVGGSLGAGATHEGVGFSTASAEDAIRHCCYYGTMPVKEVGVARGANGFYATVTYAQPSISASVGYVPASTYTPSHVQPATYSVPQQNYVPTRTVPAYSPSVSPPAKAVCINCSNGPSQSATYTRILAGY